MPTDLWTLGSAVVNGVQVANQVYQNYDAIKQKVDDFRGQVRSYANQAQSYADRAKQFVSSTGTKSTYGRKGPFVPSAAYHSKALVPYRKRQRLYPSRQTYWKARTQRFGITGKSKFKYTSSLQGINKLRRRRRSGYRRRTKKVYRKRRR